MTSCAIACGNTRSCSERWFTWPQRRLRDSTYAKTRLPLNGPGDISGMENALETIRPEPHAMPLTGRRGHSRLRLSLEAKVELIGGPAKCSLENVSARGARI